MFTTYLGRCFLMKLKIWELSLATALVITLLWGALLDANAQDLSQRLIRLHIIPHSDEILCQDFKREVRDAVQNMVQPILEEAQTMDEAMLLLEQYLPALETLVTQMAQYAGIEQAVFTRLARQNFPTRAYNGFTLPAGAYYALQIELGQAEGQNWWCVVFPPLCFEAAVAPPALEAMGFYEDDIALILDDSEGLALRFRTLELLSSLRGLLG